MRNNTNIHISGLAIVVILAMGMLFQVYAQANYQECRAQADRLIFEAISNPGSLAGADIGDVIDCLNGIPSPALTPYQQWHRKYLLGYLNYLLGIQQNNTNAAAAAANSFNQAAQRFMDVYSSYDNNFANEDKRNFSKYMRSWALIRKFLCSNNRQDVDDAIENLQGFAMSADLQDDRSFLLGYAYLLRANYYYNEALHTNTLAAGLFDDLGQARQLFAAIPAGSPLSRLARYFTGLCHYLTYQYQCLARIVGGEDYLHGNVAGVGPPNGADLVDANSIFQNLFAQYNGVPAVRGNIAYLMDLIRLQRVADQLIDEITEVYDRSETLNVPGAPVLGSNSSLLSAAASLLCANGLNNPPGAGDPEARFWFGVASLIQQFKNNLPNQYFGPNVAVNGGNFNNPIPVAASDNPDRVRYLEEERAFWNYMTAVFNFDDPGAAPDNSFRRHAELISLLQLLPPFFAYTSNVTATGTTLPPPDPAIAGPALPAGASNQQIYQAARLALTLAGMQGNTSERHQLYSLAYILLWKLRNKAGLPEEMRRPIDLLRAFALSKCFNPAIPALATACVTRIGAILSDGVIAGWPPAYNHEALWYRSYLVRQLMGFLDANGEGDMRTIANGFDPRAAYFLYIDRGIDNYRATGGCLLQGAEGSPGAMHWLNRHWVASGYPVGAGCDPLSVAPPEDRLYAFEFNTLTNFPVEYNSMRRFILNEQRYMAEMWQALVPHPAVPKPWSQAGPRESGPVEFMFLQDNVPITITAQFPNGNATWNLRILTSDSIILKDTTCNAASLGLTLLTGNRYQIIATSNGYFPVFKDTIFTEPGTMVVAFNQSISPTAQISDITPTDWVTLEHAHGLKISPASYQIRQDGASVTTQQSGQNWVSPNDYITDQPLTVGTFERFLTYDPVNGGVHITLEKDGSSHQLIGLPSAENNGLVHFSKIVPLKELNCFGVYDIVSNAIYLFLPNGEFIQRLNIPPELSGHLIYDFKINNTNADLDVVFSTIKAETMEDSKSYEANVHYPASENFVLQYTQANYSTNPPANTTARGGWFGFSP